MKLNKISVSQLALPPEKTEAVFFDDDIPGFGVRLREGGARTWIFQYRLGAKQRRITFAALDALTVQKARERAGELHAKVKLGGDPAGTKIENRAKAAETFEPAMRLFLRRQKDKLKPRSYVETERHLLKDAKPLHGMRLTKIDRRTIAARLNEIATSSGPSAANRVRAALSAFFVWCIREGFVDGNPVAYTNKAVEKGARKRMPSPDELREIWNALEPDEYGDIVRVLLFTGQRRDEIGALRRSEVRLDDALISLPPARTKNKLDHDVPLSPAAVTILKARLSAIADDEKRETLFGKAANGYGGWSKSKAALDARILHARQETAEREGRPVKPMPAWVLHDLRRSVSTLMHNDLGIEPHIVEAVLNHVSGHKGGVAGVYNKSKYAKQKAAALTAWSEYVLRAVDRAEGTVVSLRKAG